MDPTDQREYIIGYRDCCGKEGSYRTLCYNNKDSLPTYRITADNAVFWCFGTNNGWQGQLHHGGEARGQVLS
jgi:methylamine dehydrogenase light chain